MSRNEGQISFPVLPEKPCKDRDRPTPPPGGNWNPSQVSEEELIEAAKSEKYLLLLADMIDKDKAYLAEVHKWRRKELQPIITQTRHAILAAHRRIAARKRQIVHHKKMLKKRLAWEKIKKLREEINKV